MTAIERRRRPRIEWLSAGSLKLHATLLAGLALCGVASWMEWTRALNGNAIAWVYAFEWPLFAVMGTWLWWRLLRGDMPGGEVRPKARPARTVRRPEIAPDDPDLLAWNDYLSRLHAADPPGGPPKR